MPACAGMTEVGHALGPYAALRMLLRRGLGSFLSDTAKTVSRCLSQTVTPAQAGVHDGARAVNRVVAVAKAHIKIRATNAKVIKPLLVIFCHMLTFAAVWTISSSATQPHFQN